MTAADGFGTATTVPSAKIVGVPVHIIETRRVLEFMEQWIRQRDGCHWIAVTGSHGIVESYRNPEFKAILNSADLSLPDGKWTARVAARRASSAATQVRGADLLLAFCELASRKGYKNYFYGDTEEVLGLLSSSLREKFPGVPVVGTYSPPFRPLTSDEDADITNRINQAGPDVLWVGLGLPKQERWIFAHLDKLKVPVIVAVGAAFKFASGKVKAAPRWVSERGLEWVWRLMHEPRRVGRRVLVYGPQFVALSLLELSGLRKYD